ncbi:hypothetical protein GVAV_003136 [Gurleya vavrai]
MTGESSSEDDIKKLREMQQQKVDQIDHKIENSISIKNLDYTTTKNDLQCHFKSCGSVKNTTILYDHKKKIITAAYIEFKTNNGAVLALSLNNSLLKGKCIVVKKKAAPQIKKLFNKNF